MPRDELWSRESPLWTRFYSMPPGQELGPEAEAELQQVWLCRKWRQEQIGDVVVFIPSTDQD